MKISQITPLRENVFELKKGHNSLGLNKEDTAVIKFGGIQTAFTLNECKEDTDVYLPLSLEEHLVTVSVAHDGSYKDKQGKQQILLEKMFKVLSKMEIGQRLLIKEGEKSRGKEGMGGNLYVIELIDIQQSKNDQPKEDVAEAIYKDTPQTFDSSK
ncbi:MAG: hypothetical protein M1834_000939 [Cirrosporium novae-zelandiae]|nr:MAG: hypothetical protein M1834_000939 [Cirrosporium novae-zelandiae]